MEWFSLNSDPLHLYDLNRTHSYNKCSFQMYLTLLVLIVVNRGNDVE